jgi:hypothetical protein
MTALRSATLIPFSSLESNAMLSCRGDLSLTIGWNAFLMVNLLDDVRVVWEASPESMFRQQQMKIDKCLCRNVSGADRHPRTGRRVKHPCRDDNRRAWLSLYDHDIGVGALLTIKTADRSPVEGMPSVVNLDFLPDMGRITPRLP